MKHGGFSQLQYQIESISQPVFAGTKDGTILACNTSFTSLLGYELPDALHLNWVTSLTHHQHQDEDCSRLEQMIPGFSCLYSTQFMHRSGKIIPVDVVAVALSITGDLRPILFIVNDGHNKESLLNSEQNDDYRLLLDSINELFYTYDVNGRITFTNRKSFDILGYHPHECLGRYLWEFVPERYREYFIKELKRRIPEGKEDTYLVKVLHRDGSERVFQLKASPIIKNGEIIGEMALAEDVTERRQMEKELQFSNETLLRIREELVAANQQQLATEEELRAQLEESEKNKNALAEAHQRLQTFIDFLPEPTFVINQQGQVELWNYAMEELTGIKARDILGRGNYEYAIPFYGRRVPMLIDMALDPQLIENNNIVVNKIENDTLFAEIYCPQLGVNGSYLSCKSAPLRERSGNLVGAIETMRNITERKKIEKALFESEQKYRNMIERIDDGYFEVDLEGNFQFVNRFLGERIAYSTEELLGKNYRAIMDEANANRVSNIFNHVYKTGKRVRDFEWYVRHRDGSQLVVESTVIPIKENNEVVGFRGIVRDVTDRKKAELALQASEKNLRQQVEYLNTLIDNLHEMFFTYDREGCITFVNKRSVDVIGYRPEEIIGCHVADFVRSDERDKVYQGIRSRLEKGSKDSYELPVIHKNGSERIIRLNASSLYGDGNKIIGGMVLAEDITERQLAQRALEISEAQYRAIVEDQTELICRSRPDGRITFVNGAYCRYFNKKKEQVLDKDFKLTIHPEDRTQVMQQLSSLSLENPSCTLEYRVVLSNGDIRWQQWTHRAIFDAFENSIYYQSVGRDITEQKAAQEKLTYLSHHDPLTGLYNRRYFEEELKRHESSSNPVGLIMCDVDGLKLVNDTLGHEQGDRLLRVVSALMKSCFRGDDILARVGGDEFAAIVPNASPKLLEERIHSIWDRVKTFNQEHGDFPISVSLGYAVRQDPQVSMLEVFKEADDNMYRKKLDSGRSARSTIVQTLVKALEARDYITEGHAERLQILMEHMAQELGMSDRTVNDLRLLAQFHDIGKVGVPNSILFKEDELTEEEYRILQKHCEIGHRIALSVPELVLISDWILKHHEWWNGEGYPLGLKREEIPLECRIMAIADAYDAMTNERPYRRAKSHQEAVEELRNKAGSQFDPKLVEVFLRVLDSIKGDNESGR
jgi:diguanylate cyclase (GGDEF)-like protein/PAS domain S-box-containing protein